METIAREPTIKIAIIGAGNVGRALGGAWSGGHAVTYGVRNPDNPKYGDLGAPASTSAAAVGGSDIVVLCTPWDTTRDALHECGDLSGTVLMDCTNPLTPDLTALTVGHTTSAAEQIAQWAPGAPVCKAMNQIGSPMMNHPRLPGTPVMFLCGDDGAKEVATPLVAELGFETVDAGDLTVARLLEPYGLLWIHLALRRGLGTDFAFALLRGTAGE
ncbi:NADPH-dependent F420 reductase [Mycobacterium parmense]|uniref:Pyrroline-5-carboxylate reductase catalytic N-terminal domain-containing protein n=1 Tax=Mycobacterium parmense TaxID=185642 RepID=A0A7I7YQZ3_9MYCO|nr:NAD(P)-binding domain-containing protein [Mycobacterium parmense]BBZ43574.1 hypothetical protein MPRM_08550 [Mycobacterium parmense]